MISKEREYRSEICKIAGFSMMSLVGRIFLQPVELFKEYGLVMLICYVIVAFALFILGFLLLIKDYDIVDSDGRY